MRNKFFWGAFVLASLAACGGGNEVATTHERSPGAAMPAPPLPPRALSASQLADNLMDFAEASFPQFFPSHPATQALAPFQLRYYPETGIYLGVVVSGGTGFQLDGIYVLGGAFGSSPVYVGQVSSFIDDGKGGGTADNGCFDLEQADKQGTNSSVAYRYSGFFSGSESVQTTVGALVEFEGHSARETVVTTIGGFNAGHSSVAFSSTGRFYAARTSATDVTHFGSEVDSVSDSIGVKVTSTVRSVASPPWVNRQASLAIGGSFTMTESQAVTTKIADSAATTASRSSTFTIRYLDRETLVVPAGTFNTCKFESTKAETGLVTLSWVVVGTGLVVKTETPTQTREATSVVFNGAPL